MSPLAIVPGAVGKVDIYGESTGSIGASGTTGGSGVIVYVDWAYGSESYETSRDLNAKTDLEAGSYIVTITDSLGATASHTFVVPQNPVITISLPSITNVAIHGGSTGVIGVPAVSGGDGDFSYLWTCDEDITVPSPSSLTSKTGLRAGTYTLTVNDGVGATATRDFVVSQNPPIKISEGTMRSVPFYGTAAHNTGSIEDVDVTGGSGEYTITWSTLSGSGSVNDPTELGDKEVKAGKYRLAVEDDAGATASRIFVVTKNTHVVRGGKKDRVVAYM